LGGVFGAGGAVVVGAVLWAGGWSRQVVRSRGGAGGKVRSRVVRERRPVAGSPAGRGAAGLVGAEGVEGGLGFVVDHYVVPAGEDL
jgi:hypothetical protein